MKEPSRPFDGNHALLIGNVLGLLLREKDGVLPDIVTEVEPVMIGPDYSNQIRITRKGATDSATYLLTVERIAAEGVGTFVVPDPDTPEES